MKRTGGSAGPSSRSGSTEPVARITSAATPLADDLAVRTHRYLIQMGIRVVCFIGAVAIDHWTRWPLLAGAVVLPYIAVVLANAGRSGETDPGTFLEPPSLPQGPDPRAGPSADPSPGPYPSRPGPDQGDRP